MSTHPLWSDQYWPLVIKLYLTPPVGVKDEYSRAVVDLALFLHIPPAHLRERMEEADHPATPSLRRMRALYEANTRRLNRDVKQLRQMAGFGSAGAFYEGVQADESFERHFRPVADDTPFTPAMLVMVLDLYYQLVPHTMTVHTPEVVELARHLRVTPTEVRQALHAFLAIDPGVPTRERDVTVPASLANAAADIWRQCDDGDMDKAAAMARRFTPYFS